jgi:hypothetical protein
VDKTKNKKGTFLKTKTLSGDRERPARAQASVINYGEVLF